jgi:plastocyanin
MWTYFFNRPALLGLSFSATLAVVTGCGGQSDTGTAVLVPEPNSLSKTAPASGRTAAPAASTSPAPSTAEATGTAAPVKAEGWGTLKGHVVFAGDPPTAKVLVDKGKAEKNPEVCAKDAPIESERLVVDPATKGVKFALVYLPKPTAVNDDAKKAAASGKIEFDQKGCVFKPHVLGLMTGVPVTLKSSDPMNHNVNSKLKNSPFNPTVAGGTSFSFTPSSPERTPGQVVCDIHPWMSSWWMVLDSPYFAVTDEKGNFEIKNVPAGTQKVVVWQEAVAKGGFVTPPSGQDINIKAGATTEEQFTIDPTRLLPGS